MESEYKKSKIFFNLICGYFFLSFTVFISFMIVRKFFISPDYFNTYKIIFAIVTVFLFSFLTLQFLGIALIRNQYYQNNLKYFIEIDKEKKLMIFHDKENLTKRLIDFSTVKAVELYYSWNSSPFSSDLGYSKIIFLDGNSVFVTQNNINQYHIYKIFKKKVTVNKSKFVNALK
jgi:hypothetical protein